MAAAFSCDLEDWNHGLHLEKNDHTSYPCVWSLLYKLHRYKIRATFYVLGKFRDEFPTMIYSIEKDGHTIKSHGQEHYHWEEADRKPYSFLGFCGGFYFRLFPYWLIKLMVMLHGHFYIHPHDIDVGHPKIKPWWLNWKRHVGLKTAEAKLDRLLKEVRFE